MKRLVGIILILSFLLLFGFLGLNLVKKSKEKQAVVPQKLVNQKGENMQITSPAFIHNSQIPSKYTCDGDDINPALDFKDIPANTQSLTLIMDDPDAPMGTWTHWIIMNMDPGITTIPENSVPSNSIQGTNSAGKQSYGSPCPPSGIHRYFFKLYALDTKLSLSSSAKANEVVQAMNGHILAQAELIGLYSRQ